MAGLPSYLALLAICGFLGAVWLASKASRVVGLSPVALEIATGVLLGPSVLGLVGREYAVCAARHADCAAPPDLERRLREGLPLGTTLGRIASMGYCRMDDFVHQPTLPPDDSKAYLMTGVDDENQAGRPSPYRGQLEVWGGTRKKPAAPELDFHYPGSPAKDRDGGGGDAPQDEAVAGGAEGADAEPAAERPAARARHPPPSPAPAHAGTGVDEERGGGGGGHRRLAGAHTDYAGYGDCLVQACVADMESQCGRAPDAFTLVGQAGVALMLFESGLHFDFERASTIIGPQVIAVAVAGTLLPFVSGLLVAMAIGVPLVPAIAVGAALAPTSLGMALRLLGNAGVVHHDFARSIVAAAHLEDMMSLVLFSVAYSLKDGYDVMRTVCNPIIGIAFMGVAMILAVQAFPDVVQVLFRVINYSDRGEEETLFMMMMALLLVYAILTHLMGTHLWGCFIAGLSFACFTVDQGKNHALHVWGRQTKRLVAWMVRIFFACTVAFALPVDHFLTLEVFWKGTVLGLGPGILAKVVSGAFIDRARFVVGWAMVGRAEFAYLIAEMAMSAQLIDGKTYSICIWALLYATLSAPVVLRVVLNRYIAAEGIEVVKSPHAEEECDHGFPEPRALEVPHLGKKPVTFGKGQDDLEVASARKTTSTLPPLKSAAGGSSPGSRSCGGGTRSDAGSSPGRSWREPKPWWGFKRVPRQPTHESGLVCCLFFRRLST